MQRFKILVALIIMVLIPIQCFADEDDDIVVFTEQGETFYNPPEVVKKDTPSDLIQELPEETLPEYQFAGEYTLEYLFNHFGIIAFENVDLSQHCMGNLLIKGDLSGNYNNFADSPYTVEPSYIQGLISKPGGPNGRSKYSGIPIYVGDVNAVQGSTLNGIPNYNHQDPIYITNTYVDWDRIQSLATDEIADVQLANDTYELITVQWSWQDINIRRGTVTNVVTRNQYCKIHLVGEDTGETTVINVLDGGSVINPQVVGLSQGEENPDGEPICIMYPNATEVKIPPEMTPEIGCVLAPFADIVITGGNTNGCLLGKNITTTAEGHMWPYKAIPKSHVEESESQGETASESESESEILTEIITEVETETIETETETEEMTETEITTEAEVTTETELHSETESESETEPFQIETEVVVIETETEEIETEYATEFMTESETEKITETETITETIIEKIIESETNKIETELPKETERVSERSTESEMVVTEKQTEKVTERATEKPTEKSTEQKILITEKPVEKQTEKIMEPQTEKVTEKQTERPTEQQTEKKPTGFLGAYDPRQTEAASAKSKKVKGVNRQKETEGFFVPEDNVTVVPKTGDYTPLLKWTIGLIFGLVAIASLVMLLANRRR